MLKITIKKLNHYKLISFIVSVLFIDQNLSQKFLSKYFACVSLCKYFINASVLKKASSFFQFDKLEEDSHYSFNKIIKTLEIISLERVASFNLYNRFSRYSNEKENMPMQFCIENFNRAKNLFAFTPNYI